MYGPKYSIADITDRDWDLVIKSISGAYKDAQLVGSNPYHRGHKNVWEGKTYAQQMAEVKVLPYPKGLHKSIYDLLTFNEQKRVQALGKIPGQAAWVKIDPKYGGRDASATGLDDDDWKLIVLSNEAYVRQNDKPSYYQSVSFELSVWQKWDEAAKLDFTKRQPFPSNIHAVVYKALNDTQKKRLHWAVRFFSFKRTRDPKQPFIEWGFISKEKDSILDKKGKVTTQNLKSKHQAIIEDIKEAGLSPKLMGSVVKAKKLTKKVIWPYNLSIAKLRTTNKTLVKKKVMPSDFLLGQLTQHIAIKAKIAETFFENHLRQVVNSDGIARYLKEAQLKLRISKFIWGSRQYLVRKEFVPYIDNKESPGPFLSIRRMPILWLYKNSIAKLIELSMPMIYNNCHRLKMSSVLCSQYSLNKQRFKRHRKVIREGFWIRWSYLEGLKSWEVAEERADDLSDRFKLLFKQRSHWHHNKEFLRYKIFRKFFKWQFARYRHISKNRLFIYLFRRQFQNLTGYSERVFFRHWLTYRRGTAKYWGMCNLVQEFSQALLLMPQQLFYHCV
jgi:hypothetical protein